ncbi:MAG: hypothetical protein ACI8P0_001595 [Planctomycetaceae bacterium]|jgi:hypothetical protein
MSVERQFSCDICRNTLQPKELHGIHFEATGFKESNPHNSQRHVCSVCLKSFERMINLQSVPIGD